MSHKIDRLKLPTESHNFTDMFLCKGCGITNGKQVTNKRLLERVKV